jgi:cob(I)alamin adenosyltransferase
LSAYVAYTFLYDPSADLRCDFEILSDEIASMIGLVRALIDDRVVQDGGELREDLLKISELMYHINPSLRTKIAVTGEELAWLHEKAVRLQVDPSSRFVVPQGCVPAAYSHVIRSKCKALVRLLSRHAQQGHPVDDILFDFINLFSNYFFALALRLNHVYGVTEVPFTSRVYPVA